MALLIEIMGWAGAIFILAAYLMLTYHGLSAKSTAYQWMNLIGASLIAINSFANQSYPSFGLNFAWILVAVYGLYIIVKK